jgi:hypothetical protein
MPQTYILNAEGTNDTAAISAVLSAIGSSLASLQFPASPIAVTNSVTIPANVALHFNNGGGVFINTGQTLTVRGAVIAPPVKVFFNALASQGTVSFAGNVRMRYWQAEWWGAIPDNSTDCTGALNASLAAIVSAGGGTLELDFGTYLCTGSVNATSGAVVYPPVNGWTGGVINSIPISIVGKGIPAWGDYLTNCTGTTIRSTTTYSGAIQFPALLGGGLAYHAITPTDYFNFTNYVSMNLENVRVSTYNNPSIGGVNFMMNNRVSMRNVEVDVNVPETAQLSTACSLPTHEVIGVAFQWLNNGQAVCDNVTVTGYKYGFFSGDHFRATNFVMATRCLNGFWFYNTAGYAEGPLYSYRNLHDILFDGTVNLVNIKIQIEADTNSGTWTQKTIGTTLDFIDAGNVTQGVIEYVAESPLGVQDYALTISGLTKTILKNFFNTGPLSKYTNTTRVTVQDGLANAINQPFNTDVYGAGSFTHSTSVNTDQIVCTKQGTFRLTAVLNFVAVGLLVDNGTGERMGQFTVNGTAIAPIMSVKACTGRPTSVSLNAEYFFFKGDVIRVQAYQNSGGDLESYGAANGLAATVSISEIR